VPAEGARHPSNGEVADRALVDVARISTPAQSGNPHRRRLKLVLLSSEHLDDNFRARTRRPPRQAR
jgi:hypothetical protein